MRNLTIERTDVTPAVNFNASTGELKISGRAYSTDINKFYEELNAWIDDYLKNPQTVTTLILELEYYNSAFYKLMFILIEKCKKTLKQDKSFAIKWYHQRDDEDSSEDANEISAIIDYPIEIVELD